MFAIKIACFVIAIAFVCVPIIYGFTNGRICSRRQAATGFALFIIFILAALAVTGIENQDHMHEVQAKERYAETVYKAVGLIDFTWYDEDASVVFYNDTRRNNARCVAPVDKTGKVYIVFYDGAACSPIVPEPLNK